MTSLEKMELDFLFLAYTAVWIVMFGFMYRMLGRARKLERDVELLRKTWRDEPVPVERPDSAIDPTAAGPSV